MKNILLFTLFITSIMNAQNYQFLGSYTSNGTPEYFDGRDDVSVETLELISNSLPESYPVPEYNPHYISSGYDTNVTLTEDAEIWVTFISEGAGYRNVLGFYTYDANSSEVQKPEDEDITIIFPNASALGSGGGLQVGDKVKIGTFTAGTGIGWVLLANAWNGSQVTSGLWQLYSNAEFNPESDPNLQNHNVLLSDPDNERVILGFEDIRRDYNSCDNDFNDAVFYVTANPFTAMNITNYADVDSATDVTSANNGGLESNGDLATLIANRNFNRIKTNSFKNRKSLQKKFKKSTNILAKSNGKFSLSSLFPETGMFGTETSYSSSPTDLLAVTNAEDIFSVDYYEGEKRISASLATYTKDGIYDHSKVICDRLNSSSLEDIRTLTLKGHEIIMIKIERKNEEIEYALNFSIEILENKYRLHSYWNIAQYPKGDYLNFQVWGSSMGQVSTIANHILNKLDNDKTIVSDVVEDRIPTVFVKNGSYKNGALHLNIKNKSNASSFYFEGNIRETELSETELVSLNGNLTNSFEEEVIIKTNNLFDVGFYIKADNSPQKDALYLADGPWGVDYLESDVTISLFKIENDYNSLENESYSVERNIVVEGEVYGTLNVFRNVLAGELSFDTSNYENIEFNIKNNLPVEVVLVTENLEDWNSRLRYQLPVNNEASLKSVKLKDFKDQNGDVGDYSKVRGFVFSVQGNYSTFKAFNISVSGLAFINSEAYSINEFANRAIKKIYNYPNPFKGSTTIVLPNELEKANVTIVDILGRVVYNQKFEALKTKNEIVLNLSYLTQGLYKCIVYNSTAKFQTSLLIN